MQTIRIRALALLGAVAATVGIVSFASPAEAETMAVSYKDLDLHSARGLQALRIRVRAAAAELCGPEATPLGSQAAACRRAAVAQAMASLPVDATAPRLATR